MTFRAKDHRVNPADSPDGVRQAIQDMRTGIHRSEYSNALVRASRTATRNFGMNTEDADTHLIWHLILENERLNEAVFRYFETAVHSPFVVKP